MTSSLAAFMIWTMPINLDSSAFDNGQAINVAITLDAERAEAHIDFTGTSAAEFNNLNAPASVCQAAVMYVFRTLVEADIPLNAGCRRPLYLTIPEGTHPSSPSLFKS